MGQDPAACEVVLLSRANCHLLVVVPNRVDLNHTRPPPCRVSAGDWLLGEDREECHSHHWFGSVNLPPVPLGRIAVTTLKSGSEGKPSPTMCRVGSSNTKGLSEVT